MRNTNSLTPAHMLVLAIGIILIDCGIYAANLSNIFPLGDEIALRAHAHGQIPGWITEGFSNYFKAYPEFHKPFTNFIRPVVNAIYWLFSFDPTGASQLIAVNYLTHGLIVAIIVDLSIRHGHARSRTFLAGLAAYWLPAFWASPMPTSPAFAFDGVAALLCLLSVLCLSSSRMVLGGLLLAMAMFTKEVAMPVTLAIMVYGVVSRRWRLVLIAGLVLGAWGLARVNAFGTLLGGVYAGGDNGSLLQLMKKLLTPPVLPFGRNNPVLSDTVITMGDQQRHLLRSIYQVGTIALVFIGLKHLKSEPLPTQLAKAASTTAYEVYRPLLLLMITAISLAYLMVIGQETRFSYLASVMVLAWLVTSESKNNSADMALGVLLLGGCILSVSAIAMSRSDADKDAFAYSESRQLWQTLRTHPMGPPVYTLGDTSSRYASGESIAAWAGVPRQVLRGLSINVDGCTTTEHAQTIYTVGQSSRDAGTKIITVTIPDCARFTFEGAHHDLIAAHVQGDRLTRSAHISYRFPGLRTQAGRGDRVEFDYGKQAEVQLQRGAVGLMWAPAKRQWVWL